MSFEQEKKLIDQAIQEYLSEIKPQNEKRALIQLHQAMGYSLTGPGARWRPIFALITAEAVGGTTAEAKTLPFALALELVHNYSLIHDDLPAMDNDDFRRGQPTNHKVFGEQLAILAGDALATEPYRVIAEKYSAEPSLAVELVKVLSVASGPRGMVGGQALDVLRDWTTEKDVEFLHLYKTVALFVAAVEGASLIGGANPDQKARLIQLATSLGLLFQIADDIHDGADDEGPSFVKAVGLEKAQKYCKTLRDSAVEQAKDWGRLQDFANLIFERSVHAS